MTAKMLKEQIRLFCAFAGENYTARNNGHARYREETELIAALGNFPTLDPADREAVRGSLKDQLEASELSTFSIRCASFAVQASDATYLRPGILALLVDADALDPRDVVRTLGVLNDAASRLGVSLFPDVITPLIKSATPARRKLIEDFFFHPDSIRNLKSLGFELANIDGVLWFRSCAA